MPGDLITLPVVGGLIYCILVCARRTKLRSDANGWGPVKTNREFLRCIGKCLWPWSTPERDPTTD